MSCSGDCGNFLQMGKISEENFHNDAPGNVLLHSYIELRLTSLSKPPP